MYSQEELTLKVIVVAALLIGAVVSYFIYSFSKQQLKVLKWQQLRIKAEIETIENERKRISSDLHDELGPLLSAVRLQINHLEPTDEIERSVLEKSSSQIDEVIKRFREISYDLMPNILIRKGLVKAIAEFTSKMEASSKLKIRFTSDSVLFTPEQEINLYRVVQEIVHNTVKHAKANFLEIKIVAKNKFILITTKDDGAGFNYKEKSALGSGLGLLNLQSRVEVLKGRLLVDTAPGKGSFFTIEIPK